MIDAQTRKPIRVLTEGTARPYIMTSVDQLDRVRELLVGHAIPHWVEPDAISLDGKPAVAFINLGSRSDADRVQSLLDEAG